MSIIDTHTHVGLNWFEPVETLLSVMSANGVSRALLVQHGGYYDHEYLFECKERFPETFKVVAALDAEDPDPIATVHKLAERGAAGLRLTPNFRPVVGTSLAVWRAAGELGMAVSCQGRMDLFGSAAFLRLLDGCQKTPVVLEHLAGVRQAAPPYAEFDGVLRLAARENVFIKIPGLGELGSRPSVLRLGFDIEGVPPLFERTLESFGPNRMMWGSDFPPVAGREGYRNALAGVREYSAFDQEDLGWILGRTASAVWGFS